MLISRLPALYLEPLPVEVTYPEPEPPPVSRFDAIVRGLNAQAVREAAAKAAQQCAAEAQALRQQLTDATDSAANGGFRGGVRGLFGDDAGAGDSRGDIWKAFGPPYHHP
jgi:hypothetical protein